MHWVIRLPVVSRPALAAPQDCPGAGGDQAGVGGGAGADCEAEAQPGQGSGEEREWGAPAGGRLQL